MNKSSYIILLFICCVVVGCIEEIPIDTTLQADINIEEVLVVEATITDELIQQKIILSRGSSFANDSIVNYEEGATVSVSDNLGNTFLFEDGSNGEYISSEPFAAQPGNTYQLSITTVTGEQFESTTVSSAGVSIIDDIYAERIISDNEVEGMAIFVDSSNPSGDFNNYRYTYEETYKIIAPNWTAVEFEIIRDDIEVIVDEDTGEIIETLFPDVTLVPREQEEQICYNTVDSNDIILSDGLLLTGTTINKNMVRFINRNDPILSHRYSILVKQFLQSPDAANFYNTLLQFSESENLFSEIQPGLIGGNINPINNTSTTVIGYFEVASVTSRRIFFNYDDFFPGEELPPYFDGLNCSNLFAPPLENPLRDGLFTMDDCGIPRPLIDYIKAEEIEFVLSTSQGLCEGPFFVTSRACGDCTVFGSNVVPDFWIE